MNTASARYCYNILVDRIERLGLVRGGEYRLAVLDFRHTPFASSTAHTRMAVHMVKEGICEHGGEVHSVGEHHLFCIVEAKVQDVLKNALQALFALTPGRAWGGGQGEFVTSLHLRNDAPRVKEIMALIGDMVAQTEREAEKTKMRAETALIAVPVAGAPVSPVSDPLFTARFSPVVQLEFIETQLPNLRFGELVRSQPVCRFNGGEVDAVVGQELYASLVDLQKRFSTSIDLIAQYLLRHHLTQNLGEMLLTDLKDGKAIGAASQIFINLQLDTLRSAAFSQFDDAVGELRRKVVIDLTVTDILAHMGECMALSHMLRERGYGIGLAGVSLKALEEIELERLPLTAVKLMWQSDGVLSAKARQRLDVLAQRGCLVVLGRSDRPSAIIWGQEFGIRHFQGAAVDDATAKHFHGGCAAAESL
ncbi:MAG: hypothetical protein K2X44_09965, partial [Magnetospirillum sp.]|nr:hypothetical protein [Magnetospirillum sp.]